MRHRNSGSSRSPRSRRRRGVALLLVLIGVATVTILASAYLASRDNSVEISRNIKSAVDGRWAAVAAVERGVAVLKSSSAWRTSGTGVLLADHAMGDLTIDVFIEDMATGGVPTAQTQHVLIIATATPENGPSQTATATAFVPFQPPGGAAAVDLAEFAIFGKDAVTLRESATLRRWPAAPMSDAGGRIAIGTLAINSGRVSILDDALAVDTTLYKVPGASSTLLSNNSPLHVPVVELPDEPHLAGPRGPGVLDPDLDLTTYTDLDLTSAILTFATHARHSTIDMTASTLTLDGNVTLVSEGPMTMLDSSIVVTGDASIVVFDALNMNGSAISIADGATLKLFVSKNLTLVDGAIGDNPSAPDPSGGEPYQDPLAVQVWQNSWFKGGGNIIWGIGPEAVIKGAVYAPWARVEVNGNSAVYGRVLAERVTARLNAGIYYDHRLDARAGYIYPESGLYDELLNLVLGLDTLTALDPDLLLAVSILLNVQVLCTGDAYGAPNDPDALGPLDVEYSLRTFGADIRQWEADVVASMGGESGEGGFPMEAPIEP